MKKLKQFLILALLVLLLVGVRFFEETLFFNSYLNFFELIQKKQTEPVWQLIFNIFFRYWINSFISIAILYVAFGKKSILKFSFLLYLAFFLILFPLFFILWKQMPAEDYLAFFYVRRFLIHPLFILILLPAFYYQKLRKKLRNKKYK